MQKILICGFPHSGTSILKSIIGHCEDVEEIYTETNKIHCTTDKKFILAKWPYIYKKYFDEEYDDYIKIFIIRNPVFIFSSLNKRFNYKIPDDHSIELYIDTVRLFNKYKNTNDNNIYTIRYEDLFQNNYQNLKNILDNIGISYTDDIFDNSKYRNEIIPGCKLLSEKPNNSQHGEYRTWQINQSFVSNNDVSKIDLDTFQIETLINNKHILKIYPDIGIDTQSI